MRDRERTAAGRPGSQAQESTARLDLEREHRELLRDFEPPRIAVAEKRSTSYEVRHYTTYSAFEEPISSD